MSKTSYRWVAFLPELPAWETLVGGDHLRPFYLALHLAELGVAVEVHVERWTPRAARWWAERGVELRRWGRRRGGLGYVERLALAAGRLRSLAASGEPVVFYQQLPSGVIRRGRWPVWIKAAVLLIPYARRLGLPVWGAVHDIVPEHVGGLRERRPDALSPDDAAWLIRWTEWQQARLLPLCTGVTVVSRPMRALLEQRYDLEAERLLWFPAGADPELVAPLTPWRPPRRRPWRIGYVGSPHDLSFDLLRAAWRRLPADRYILRIGGMLSGDEVGGLEAVGVSEVWPEVRYPDFPRFAADVDLWVLPYADHYYREVTWELKAPLYLASGRPLVRSDGASLRLSGLARWIWATGGTPEQVARTIASLRRHPAVAAERATAARRAVLAEWSWARIVTRLHDWWLERLGRG